MRDGKKDQRQNQEDARDSGNEHGDYKELHAVANLGPDVGRMRGVIADGVMAPWGEAGDLLSLSLVTRALMRRGDHAHVGAAIGVERELYGSAVQLPSGGALDRNYLTADNSRVCRGPVAQDAVLRA